MGSNHSDSSACWWLSSWVNNTSGRIWPSISYRENEEEACSHMQIKWRSHHKAQVSLIGCWLCDCQRGGRISYYGTNSSFLADCSRFLMGLQLITELDVTSFSSWGGTSSNTFNLWATEVMLPELGTWCLLNGRFSLSSNLFDYLSNPKVCRHIPQQMAHLSQQTQKDWNTGSPLHRGWWLWGHLPYSVWPP